MADSDLTCPRGRAQPSRVAHADEAGSGATGEDVRADPAPCRARHPRVRKKESVIYALRTGFAARVMRHGCFPSPERASVQCSVKLVAFDRLPGISAAV